MIVTDPMYKTFVEWYATPATKRGEITTVALWCDKWKVPKERIADFYETTHFFEDVHQQAINWGMSQVSDYLALLDQKIREKKATRDIIAFVDIIDKLNKKGKTDKSLVFNIPENRVEEIISRTNN